MNRHFYNAIHKISYQIHLMVADLTELYKGNDESDVSFKVRVDYGYGKFHLNSVEGSYDMSLQSLINFMLQKHGHYKKLLSETTFNKVTEFNSKNPTTLFDFNENVYEQDIIDNIEHMIVCSVRNSCEMYGHDVTPFIEAEFIRASSLPCISKYGLVEDIVTLKNVFLIDLESYLENAPLLGADVNKIITAADSAMLNVEVAKLLYSEYPEASEKLLELAVKQCSKKSECISLSGTIKKISNNTALLTQLSDLKSRL